MVKRHILMAVAIGLAAPGVFAEGGVADFFRSITGALQGGRQQAAPREQGATATIGVRGMDEDDAKAAAPLPAASGDYVLMEGWAATKNEAEFLAGKKGLAARAVTLAKPKAETQETPAP